MKRLTIHLKNAPFVTRAQKNTGTKENPTLKPKKKECIMNTLSYVVKDEDEARSIVLSIDSDKSDRSSVSKWYLSNIR